MSKLIIDAKQALIDIRSGVNEKDLMHKYNLSAKGLVSLFKKLIAVGAITQNELSERMPSLGGASENLINYPNERQGYREIKAVEAVKDIKSGMSDAEIMAKYMISANGLHKLIEQIIANGLLKQDDLDDRDDLDNTVDVFGFRHRDKAGSEKADSAPISSHESLAPPEDATNGKPLNHKKPNQKRGAREFVWRCPACNKGFEKEFDECPICGVVISKFLAKQDKGDADRA